MVLGADHLIPGGRAAGKIVQQRMENKQLVQLFVGKIVLFMK